MTENVITRTSDRAKSLSAGAFQHGLTVHATSSLISLLYDAVDRDAAKSCSQKHQELQLVTAKRESGKQTPSTRHKKGRWAATRRPARGARPGT